jgi:hypothetical protein
VTAKLTEYWDERGPGTSVLIVVRDRAPTLTHEDEVEELGRRWAV